MLPAKRSLLLALAAVALLLLQEAECAGDNGRETRAEGTCRSVGSLKFDPAEQPMQRSKGLEVCSKYKKNTCCSDSHAHALRLKIREPVVAKFNPTCQKITEELVCSPCHPFVGTWQMRTVCPQLCDQWFNACRSEFYSANGAGTLTPCYGNALICSPLSSIAESGAEFCHKMGFQVGSENDVDGVECFDGSVPRQLGVAEPTEPWQEKMQRLFEEQGADPSGLFMVALFVPLVALYVGYRLLKQWRDPEAARRLQLEEYRRQQQAAYARLQQDGVDYAYDSDSSSDQEHDQQLPEGPEAAAGLAASATEELQEQVEGGERPLPKEEELTPTAAAPEQ